MFVFIRTVFTFLTYSCSALISLNLLMLANTQIVIQQKLNELFPSSTSQFQFSWVRGGSINETHRIDFGNRQIFCKINSATKFPHLFEKERNGLGLIAAQNI